VAVGFDEFDEEKERERLRKLSDREFNSGGREIYVFTCLFRKAATG
jgi:hypothetical protein